MFSIKAVSQSSGVSIETLRAWERRYQIVVPQRDSNRRRSYAPEDVIRLRKLHEATLRGHAISKLARLSDEEIGRLLAQSAGDSDSQVASRSYSEQMLTAALNYRPDDCEQALSMALALLPLNMVVKSVLSPVLHEIGERWHQGSASIAQERILTNTIRRQVGAVIEAYNKIAKGPTLVLTTVSGERHEVGLMIAALLASSRGVRCQYLGPDIPGTEIATFASKVGANAVALAFVNTEHTALVLEELATLAKELPENIHIWVGGKATEEFSAKDVAARVQILADLTALESQIELLISAHKQG